MANTHNYPIQIVRATIKDSESPTRQTYTKNNKYSEEPVQCDDIETDLAEAAPDGGWGWFIMLGGLLACMIIPGIGRCSGVFYLKLREYYGQSAMFTSFSVSLSFTLSFLLAPLASALCNIYTIRTVVALGATLCTVGVFLSAFSTDITIFFFSFGLVQGLGRALAYGPCMILLGQYFNKRRSLVAGIAKSGSALSGCVFPSMFAVLFSSYGFSGSFLMLSAINSHLFIAASLSRPLELHQHYLQRNRRTRGLNETDTVIHRKKANISNQIKNRDEDETASEQSQTDQNSLSKICMQFQRIFSGSKRNGTKQTLLDLSLLKNFAFSCVCLQQFLFIETVNTVFIFLPALAIEKGIDMIHGTYLLSVVAVCDGLSRIVLAPFMDLERVRPYRLIVYNANILAMSVSSLFMPLMSTFWQLSLVSALYGVGLGFYISQMSVVCVDVLGVENLTTSLGLLLAFEGVGSLVSPAIGGLIKDCFGRYDVTFFIGSASTFVAGAVMAAGNIWLYRRRKFNGYHVY